MKEKTLKQIRKASRERKLKKEKLVGKTRASTWGGKTTKKKDRRKAKEKLRKRDFS